MLVQSWSHPTTLLLHNRRKSPLIALCDTHSLSMENCVVRHPKLNIKFFGLSISAEGALGIGAALLVFMAALAAWRF